MIIKLTNILVKLLSTLCMIMITGLTAIVFIQVISRYVGISLPGTEELARLMVIWLTFLGCSLAMYEKIHLSVDFLVDIMPKSISKKVGIFIHSTMILFFGVLMVYGFRLSILAWGSTSSTLTIPMGLFYIMIPISSIFSIYFIILNMFDSSKKGGIVEL